LYGALESEFRTIYGAEVLVSQPLLRTFPKMSPNPYQWVWRSHKVTFVKVISHSVASYWLGKG
jgi:hypothetical protein